MSAATEAIHSIRNDLTPILWFAELAGAGDREAQKLVIKELVSRTNAIHAELDVLSSAIRGSQRGQKRITSEDFERLPSRPGEVR